MQKFKQSKSLEPYQIPVTTNYKYKMDMGEWFFPVHPSVLETVKNFNNLAQYGVCDENFTRLIELIKEKNELEDTGETVLITNGSDNAIRLILEVFATPASKFLVPVPSYAHFEAMLETCNVSEVVKPYIDYRMSIDDVYRLLIKELVNGYDVCYLVNPSMPIGHTLTRDQIRNLLDYFPKTLFVLDEAYVEFSGTRCTHLTEEFSNLIVVRTFSKFYSLASLRIGYLVTCKRLLSLIKPFYNYKDVTKLAVMCAIKTLENPDFYIENDTKYDDLRDIIRHELKSLVKKNGKIIDYIMNDGMYFTIICRDPRDLKNYFDKHSVAVRNKDSDIKGAIRLTIRDEETLRYVFDILKEY